MSLLGFRWGGDRLGQADGKCAWYRLGLLLSDRVGGTGGTRPGKVLEALLGIRMELTDGDELG